MRYSEIMGKQIPWLSAIIILIIIFGTIYAVAQQVLRNDADYPQIQLAENAAALLRKSATPESLTKGYVAINTDLSPFVEIYSSTGSIVNGNGYLQGKIPTPPLGILTASTDKAYYRVTWEPQKGVRIAAVTVNAGKYYVLSGRSLKVIEQNESYSFDIAFAAGLFALIILLVSWVIYNNTLRS